MTMLLLPLLQQAPRRLDHYHWSPHQSILNDQITKSENVASPMATGTPTIINGQLVGGPTAAAPATPAPATTLQVILRTMNMDVQLVEQPSCRLMCQYLGQLLLQLAQWHHNLLEDR